MGEIVEFPSNGHERERLPGRPGVRRGPGLIVIQEWWGLVPHINDVCDRFAAEGFVALAPDLYHGETTTEPDEAGKLMMALNLDQAAKDMARRHRPTCSAHDAVTSDRRRRHRLLHGRRPRPGARRAERPDAVAACVPVLRAHPVGATPSPTGRTLAGAGARPLRRARTASSAPTRSRQLEADAPTAVGKDVELVIYPGADHAFFNDTRPEVYDAEASAEAWDATLAFLRAEHRLSAPIAARTPTATSSTATSSSASGSVATSTAWSTPTTGPPALATGRRPRPARRPAAGAGRRRPPAWSPTSTPGADAERRRRPPRAGCGPRSSGSHTVGPQAGRRAASATPTRSSRATACAPRPVPEDDLAAAHRRLDEALPGAGPVARAATSPGARPRPSRPTSSTRPSRSLADDFRERTQPPVRPARRRAHRLRARDRQAVVGLQLLPGRPAQPGGHQHRPAGAVARRSATSSPTRPTPATTPSTAARRSGWCAAGGQLEETIFLVGTPQCLLAEGLADLGLEVLAGRRPRAAWSPSTCARSASRYDAEVVAAVARGRRGARRGAGQRRPDAPRRRAARSTTSSPTPSAGACCPATGPRSRSQFLTDPTWRAYIFCYVEGLPLCRRFVGRRPGPLRPPPHRAARARRPGGRCLVTRVIPASTG